MGVSLLSTTKTWRPRCGDLDQDRLAETAHGAPVAAGMEERLSEEQAARRLEEQLLEEQALKERLKEQLLEQQAVKQHTTGRLEEQFWTLVSTMALRTLVSTIAL